MHAKVCRRQAGNDAGQLEWRVSDNKSLNGVLVNEAPVSGDGHVLRRGDIITFGRKVAPPEFEYVFDAPPAMVSAEAAAASASSVVGEGAAADAEARNDAMAEQQNDIISEQMQRIGELQQQLDAEREQKKAEMQQRRPQTQVAADSSDFQNELVCCICRDWLVHASNVQCAHTFCWSCIDSWLLQKKFECPVCRTEVTQEPVRSRAMDTIVQKTVDRLGDADKAEHAERIVAADQALDKAKRLHAQLQTSVDDACSKGKNFFYITSAWTKRERETFQRGIKDYKGNTRQTYCKLTGLTVQWVWSADEDQLNQACHNLSLTRFVSKPEDQIRQRLLMYLRYG
jgi:hypothetical protein